jgi:DNA repair exonuclease SbcCD nuclease subunit
MIFGALSDSHNHSWSAFASTNKEGVNTRLQEILDETLRCAQEVKDKGGRLILHTGDLFHVRGSVAPSVLNPTLGVYRHIVKDMSMEVFMLAGNHDLEGREAERVGNAMTALEEVGVHVIHEPWAVDAYGLAFIPWMPSVAELKKQIEATPRRKDETILLLHAPIDGVIPGLPDHGLDPAWLAGLGFKAIFSGHYHNHRHMGGNVYSVGALTHQTWSDVGSKAGFLIVDSGAAGVDVTWRCTRAPQFVDIGAGMSEADMMAVADGNYVRARMSTGNKSEIEGMREFLLGAGAKGVTILAEPPKTTVARSESAVKAGATMEASVSDYIDRSAFDSKEKVKALCQDILREAQEVEA